MSEMISTNDIIEPIDKNILLDRSMALKKQGYRFSQAHAVLSEGKFELSYSFSNYENLQLHTLRVVIDTEEEVMSITEIIPAAVFYENEMKELFGVKIQLISADLQNKLYRINVETPLGPKKENKEEA